MHSLSSRVQHSTDISEIIVWWGQAFTWELELQFRQVICHDSQVVKQSQETAELNSDNNRKETTRQMESSTPVNCPTNKNNGGASAVGWGIIMLHVPTKAREKKRSGLSLEPAVLYYWVPNRGSSKRPNDMAHHLCLFVCPSSTEQLR